MKHSRRGWTTMASRWAILMSVVIGSVSSDAHAAETNFHVTVKDPTGAPLSDIVVGVRAKGQAGAQVTDAAGTASVTLDIPAGAQLAVVWVKEFEALQASDQERRRLAERSIALDREMVTPLEKLVRVVAGVADYSVELQYRSMRLVRAVVTEQGNPVNRLWDIGTSTSGPGSPRTDPDGSFLLIDPAGSDVIMDLKPLNDSIPGSRSLVIRIPNSSIPPEGDVGTIDVDATISATGSVRILFTAGPDQYEQVHTLSKSSVWGLALISSDGRRVMSYFAESDLDLTTQPVPIPVGTYYAVPGSIFCWTWTQRRIIEACLNGVDLSQSGIPRIVVTEGANMTVNIDPVAAELAIQAFFTPSP